MVLNLLPSGYATLEYRSPRRRRQRSDGLDGGLRPCWLHLPHARGRPLPIEKSATVSSNRRDMRYGSSSCNARPAVSTTARK
jgi:hypothetical protein